MRYITFGLCCILLITTIWLALFGLEKRTAYDRTLKIALHNAMEEAMNNMLKGSSGKAYDDDDLKNDAINILEEQLKNDDRNFSLKVDSVTADAKKGLLSMHVTEYYTRANGKVGKLEDEATIILERSARNGCSVITFKLPDDIAKGLEYPKILGQYTICNGHAYKVPAAIKLLDEKGIRIVSWINTKSNQSYTPKQLTENIVDGDAEFLAVIR